MGSPRVGNPAWLIPGKQGGQWPILVTKDILSKKRAGPAHRGPTGRGGSSEVIGTRGGSHGRLLKRGMVGPHLLPLSHHSGFSRGD